MSRADRIRRSLRGIEQTCEDTARDLGTLWREVATLETSGGTLAEWPDLARTLDRLDRLAETVKVVRGEVSDLIGERMRFDERDGTAVEGVGLVRFHPKADLERWEPDRAAAAVADRLGARLADETALYADLESGEVLPTSEVIRRVTARTVERMADLCGMTPSKAWKAGALRALGLDPKDFRYREYGRGGTVRIERGVIDTTTPTEGDPQ